MRQIGDWLLSVWSAGGLIWLGCLSVQLGRVLRGCARLPRLRAGDGALARSASSVSVVVAARNEDAAVGDALRSLLASDFHRLEVVAVDDRSTDGTGGIMAEMSRADPRLRVLHVDHLPPGWLGKNHALQTGAEAARGDWLLFTDADVRFAPSAIRQAVALAESEGLDHLTAVPSILADGVGLRVFVAWFLLVFTVWKRPWHAGDPGRRASVGMGAFNLVRRDAYRRAGGHAAIRFAVADDVALGVQLKAAGCSQNIALLELTGPGAAVAPALARGPAGAPRGRASWARPPRVDPGPALLEVRWFPDLRGAVLGLEKNAFAMFNFRPLPLAVCSLAGAVVGLGPTAAVLLAPGWQRLPWLAAYLLTAVTVGVAGRSASGRFRWAEGFLFPVAHLVLTWTVVRSAGVILKRGGVCWRDTFYSLADLRSPRVPAPPRRRAGQVLAAAGGPGRRALVAARGGGAAAMTRLPVSDPFGDR